jgi:membrane-associated protease RseP (regulator of RpoE activity)
MSVALAGSAMHFLMALALIFVALVFLGVPERGSERWVIGTVSEPSPAAEAGLEPGDTLLTVDGRDFTEDYDGLRSYLRARPDEAVTLLVERDGGERTVDVTLADANPEGDAVGFLGISPEQERVTYGPLEGAAKSVEWTGRTMWESVKGLVSIFSPDGISGYIDNLTTAAEDPDTSPREITPEDGNRFVSPIGVVRLADSQWQAGAADFLFFLFAINIFIGLFNLVPLLPFDGGHVAIATYERIREIGRGGKRYFADVSKLIPLTYGVVLVLALIFLSSLFLDIRDPLQVQ